MGDMFMNYPQLARFRELDAQLVSSGTALTITFPQPTSSIVLSRWRFGREVESKVISNGYSFVPSTRGVHMFGIWASFPREQSGKGHGTGQYAFIVRVR
ncbi:MAG: hypothetical protein DDT39_01540 [Firmicutes bacterium]|nr:hypothetical protein [candidate division NPL-UPA2 bacterium]